MGSSRARGKTNLRLFDGLQAVALIYELNMSMLIFGGLACS